jgi:hypothetical protein
MNWTFRSTSPADLSVVSAFLQNVFRMPAEHPVVEPRMARWKYWDDWSDWPESRGYVIEQDGEILAHGAVVPLTCRWENGAIKVVRVIDWGAKAKPVGGGVSLMKRIGRNVDAIMAVGGTEMTARLFPALGAKQFGMAHRYARPLRPFRRLAGENKTDWRVGARFARGLFWWLKAPSSVPAAWTACRVTPDQLASACFPLPTPRPGMAVFERSIGSLDYYLRCPSVSFELYKVEKDNTTRGYFLLSVLQRQVRLVESWVDSEDPGAWRALHRLAVRQARQHPDAVEFVTLCSDSVTRQSLLECGFQYRGSLPIYLLDCSKQGLPGGELRVQMLEGDAAYLHDGSGGLWA